MKIKDLVVITWMHVFSPKTKLKQKKPPKTKGEKT